MGCYNSKNTILDVYSDGTLRPIQNEIHQVVESGSYSVERQSFTLTTSNWECPTCSFVNEAGNKNCSMCFICPSRPQDIERVRKEQELLREAALAADKLNRANELEQKTHKLRSASVGTNDHDQILKIGPPQFAITMADIQRAKSEQARRHSEPTVTELLERNESATNELFRIYHTTDSHENLNIFGKNGMKFAQANTSQLQIPSHELSLEDSSNQSHQNGIHDFADNPERRIETRLGTSLEENQSTVYEPDIKECIVCGDEKTWVHIGDCSQPVCGDCIAADVRAQTEKRTGRFWCPMRCHAIPYITLRNLHKSGIFSSELWTTVSTLYNNAGIEEIAAHSGQVVLICVNCEEKLMCQQHQRGTVTCHSRYCGGGTEICIEHGLALRVISEVEDDVAKFSDQEQELGFSKSTNIPNISANDPLSNMVRNSGVNYRKSKASGQAKHCPLCLQKNKNGDLEGMTSDELQKTTRNCPKCGRRTYRDGGCRHMTCVCGHEYFWCCLRAYRDAEEARAHRRDSSCDEYL
jgi:hypothetical protein